MIGVPGIGTARHASSGAWGEPRPRTEELTMKRSQKIAAGVGAVLLAGGVAAPASAQTVTREDPAGDAPARIDITRVRYAHLDDRVRVAARIPDLGAAGTADLLISRFEIFEAGYVARIRKVTGKQAKVSLLYYDHFDLRKRACRGLTGSWEADKIRLKVPRSCLKGHRTTYVFTQFVIARGEPFDEAPAVKRLKRS